MTMRDDFVVLILSHGRAEALERHTMRSLTRWGYTGHLLIVLDDEDESRPEYEARFGTEKVVTFHKDDVDVDMLDNAGSRAVVVYARNAAPGIAAALGFTYYMLLDDDYDQFMFRFPRDDPDGRTRLTYAYTHHLDDVFSAMVDFLDDTGALTVTMAQGGDLIGGVTSHNWRRGLLRKAMNTFVARTDNPVVFLGRLNEDACMYVVENQRGKLLFTFMDFVVHQPATQTIKGGLTEAYLEYGTYRKSFYAVMVAPDAVAISTMGVTGHRIHHHMRWENIAPKIMSERWRKPR